MHLPMNMITLLLLELLINSHIKEILIYSCLLILLSSLYTIHQSPW